MYLKKKSQTAVIRLRDLDIKYRQHYYEVGKPDA